MRDPLGMRWAVACPRAWRGAVARGDGADLSCGAVHGRTRAGRGHHGWLHGLAADRRRVHVVPLLPRITVGERVLSRSPAPGLGMLARADPGNAQGPAGVHQESPEQARRSGSVHLRDQPLCRAETSCQAQRACPVCGHRLRRPPRWRPVMGRPVRAWLGACRPGMQRARSGSWAKTRCCGAAQAVDAGRIDARVAADDLRPCRLSRGASPRRANDHLRGGVGHAHWRGAAWLRSDAMSTRDAVAPERIDGMRRLQLARGRFSSRWPAT